MENTGSWSYLFYKGTWSFGTHKAHQRHQELVETQAWIILFNIFKIISILKPHENENRAQLAVPMFPIFAILFATSSVWKVEVLWIQTALLIIYYTLRWISIPSLLHTGWETIKDSKAERHSLSNCTALERLSHYCCQLQSFPACMTDEKIHFCDKSGNEDRKWHHMNPAFWQGS